MVVKITWLDTADSYVVKLKNKGDSFECALCNSDGRVHSPTRYHCNIAPDKLKWRIVKLPEGAEIIVSKKESQVKDIKEKPVRKTVNKTRIEKYMDKGNTLTKLAEEVGFSVSTISNVKNGGSVSNEIVEVVNSYLEKQGY